MVFPQQRTFARVLRLARAQVLAPDCRTISRIIAACGLDQQDWSADYRVFPRSPWRQQSHFEVPVAAGLEDFAGRDHIAVAGNFPTWPRPEGISLTCIACSGPMSPPFHVNLIYGLRFIQYTLLLAAQKAYGSSEWPNPGGGTVARLADGAGKVKSLARHIRDASASRTRRPCP